MQYDIIVFSHLRWHSVFQRPQHLMTGFSQNYSVLFIEEPLPPAEGDPEGSYNIEKINEKLHVLTPFIRWESWEDMTKYYLSIINSYVETPENSIFWFYSPYYIHILDSLTPKKVVYDCMDELSNFKFASPDLPIFERELISKSEVVFTGGKSLYESKKRHHSNTYCFPSSVDGKHFQKALASETEIPADLLQIRAPRVGFYGVIDERMDMELLQKLSILLPDVSFVMIGPFAKIEEDEAAKNSNIHYLGKRNYEELPNYLKGFDVTFMPFAINDSTKFISPTKTLEYMAAEKPIVSTPIYDVVRDYSDVVTIADTAEGFAEGIKKYLSESAEEKTHRIQLEKLVVESTSWSNTIAQMKELMGLTEDVYSF